MHSLYVLQPGTYLRKDGETLRIVRDGQVIETIPATGLKQLALAGRASISGAVLDYLIRNKIDTVLTERQLCRMILSTVNRKTWRKDSCRWR